MSTEKKATMLGIGMDLWASAKSAGTWVGGALKGEFNNKATIGQIVFDAVISMFPVTGELTAIRDLVAIVMRISGDTREAQKVLNWISIVLCLLPIIPVFGGLLKGIGRLLVTIIKDATKTKEITAAILAYLRKMGHGDPKSFLNTLSFSKYQSRILTEFKKFIYRFKSALGFVNKRMGAVLPSNVKAFINSMGPQLDNLVKLADKMIPSAIKELDRALNQVRSEMIKQMNHAGTRIGGGKTKIMTHEARLGTAAAKTIASKGHKPAPLSHYKHKEGWPDLRSYVVVDKITGVKQYPDIHSFSKVAAIEPKLLKAGLKTPLFRVVEQADPRITGSYWAEKMSENGKAWRLDCAVKGAWSTNGAYALLDHVPTINEMRKLGITVPDNWDGLRVWRGKIAEQVDNESGKGHKATNLLLPGGDIQIFISFRDPHNAPVKQYIEKLIKAKPTHWADAKIPQDVTTVVEYLQKRERSAKTVSQGRTLRTISTTGRATERTTQQDRK